jgi:MFS family permease
LLSGVFFSFLANYYSKKILLIIQLLIWTSGVTLTGFIQNYSHFIFARVLVSSGQGGINSLCVSFITDLVDESIRGILLNFIIPIGIAISIYTMF